MEPQRLTAIPALPARRADAHKGDFGRVLVVGGSRGMVGAVAMAANAALRGGAGLVTFAAPEPIQLTVAGLCPCATSMPLACEADGSLAAEGVSQAIGVAKACDVLAVGPGMAVGRRQEELVAAAIAQDKPLVLDADGLNNLAHISDWPQRRRCALVLTPHPGEFARLLGRSIADVQADREATAISAAAQWAVAADDEAGPLVCVLKGAGTVVTDGQCVYANDTGNPGMATGGSGDVLTGLIAALIGQGMSPLDAACLGVWTHGRAGDLAAERLGEMSLIATNLLDELPAALRESAG
ncbi:MAG: NAD(P)H-hydrate dehydratase [Planctomycetota bacterium]|jgi:NAD(P)H-hydrate epimerase